MKMPQNNPSGYDHAAVTNMTALNGTVRFMVLHSAADDNVHFQNLLGLVDKLDQAGVGNYDMHAYPDSTHGIYFHEAHRAVLDRRPIYSFTFVFIFAFVYMFLIFIFRNDILADKCVQWSMGRSKACLAEP